MAGREFSWSMKTRSPPIPSGSSAPSPYIVSPRTDLLLIVGAVLLCPAILLPMAELSSPYTVWLTVMTLGAVGHHLPSFLRTYGDKEIFNRYKTRLIVAPILLFALTLGFSLKDLHGMLLISMCWSIWHGMMQHFGFLRIYDSKVRAISPRTARLDWWISFSWFGLALTYSPNQSSSLLDALYESGIPFIPPTVVDGLQVVFVVLTAAITLLYIYNAIAGKEPRSWMKLGLLIGTFSYVWVVRVLTPDPFLSVALFELLHAMQYLAIVWAFNRRLVEKGSTGVLPRAFYLPGAASVALYVGACLAYGGVALVVFTQVPESIFKQVLEAALITSGLLHFYYDGFIWKLKQPETLRGLDLEAKDGSMRAATVVWSSVGQAALVGVGVILLASLELNTTRPDRLDKEMAILQAVPESATALNNVGSELLQRERYEEALPPLRRALELQPTLTVTSNSLSDALALLAQQHSQSGQLEAALLYLREAVEIEPESAERHNDLGALLATLGRYDEAEFTLREALLLDPDHAAARENLARVQQVR
jgi:tetratricopeptide (TPR) repeat protein